MIRYLVTAVTVVGTLAGVRRHQSTPCGDTVCQEATSPRSFAIAPWALIKEQTVIKENDLLLQ